MKKKQPIGGLIAICAMLTIILDTKTAIYGAQNGLQLCIHTIIPSLFPFFVLSRIVNSYFLGKNIKLLSPLGRLCKIPKGTESILLLGFIAGYPVGARLVAQAYDAGKLSYSSAKRMLGFCNNAGPAFLFGMFAPLFPNPLVTAVLWLVHIVSALMVGFLLPNSTAEHSQIDTAKPVSLPEALQEAIRSIAVVCGWVVVFRMIIEFCSRWFLWMLPTEAQVLFSGLLELSNGCVLLGKQPNLGTKFILSGVILAFGGLCVGMQTVSVTQKLGVGYYFPGKVLQTLFSLLLCGIAQQVVIPSEERLAMPVLYYILTLALAAILVCFLWRKKVVAFSGKILYNMGKHQQKGVAICCSERK